MATLDAAHLSIPPGTGSATISLTGTGTTWTAGTPGSPTFTLAGGPGAAIAAQSVQDATHAMLTIAAGSTPGVLTITDPSTGATALVSVRPFVHYLPRRRSR